MEVLTQKPTTISHSIIASHVLLQSRYIEPYYLATRKWGDTTAQIAKYLLQGDIAAVMLKRAGN